MDLSDTKDCRYTQDLTTGEITRHEIVRAIASTISNKASGGDEITNGILKQISTTIAPHLHCIYNVCLEEGYCPKHFRSAVTIALRKPGKSKYSTATSYRPIALLNTLSKILEFMLAKRISYLAETHKLLPRTYMGARRSVSTEHALHYPVERIHAAWNKDKVATTLLLDVSGAFENVSRPRLLHNLRSKRIDERIVRWIESFLDNRTTILKTKEHETNKVDVTVGIPQGSSLSSILFLFYNASLLEELRNKNIEACGFVDDVALLVKGNNAKENCEQLTEIHESVCKKWARTHGAKFSSSKYQLCHVTRKRQDISDAVTINGNTIVASKEAVKYLGVMLDSKLNWKAQINGNKTKALKTIGALASLAGSTWGARLIRMRQMMHAVFLRQLTHGCSVWYTPHEEKGHLKGVIKSLASVQYRAQRAIIGAYRVTSRSALQIETHTSPMHIYLDHMTSLTALRIAISPAYDAIVGDRSKKKSQIMSPSEKLTKRLERKAKTSIDDLEIITPFAAPPWWNSPVTIVRSSKETAEEEHKKLLKETNALV